MAGLERREGWGGFDKRKNQTMSSRFIDPDYELLLLKTISIQSWLFSGLWLGTLSVTLRNIMFLRLNFNIYDIKLG